MVTPRFGGDAFAKPLLRALEERPGAYDLSCVRGIVSSGVMWSPPVKQGLLAHLPEATFFRRYRETFAS